MKPATAKIRLVHEHERRTSNALAVFAPWPLKADWLLQIVDRETPRILDQWGRFP